MYAEINCLSQLDNPNLKLWESTKSLIQRKTQHLTRTHPDIDHSEIRLKALNNRSYARLIFHDRAHRRMEAYVMDRDLNRAISACFAKAERLLDKPKRLKH